MHYSILNYMRYIHTHTHRTSMLVSTVWPWFGFLRSTWLLHVMSDRSRICSNRTRLSLHLTVWIQTAHVELCQRVQVEPWRLLLHLFFNFSLKLDFDFFKLWWCIALCDYPLILLLRCLRVHVKDMAGRWQFQTRSIEKVLSSVSQEKD